MAESAAKDLTEARDKLIEELGREITDQRVLQAMRVVPRERFVPKDLRWTAYENRPLPIGYGQTISQPLMVAMMTQALQLTGNEKVLEIGTGSGYQAAVLAQLALEVVTVERIAPLARRAADRLADLGYSNVEVHVAGEALGWPEDAPYDAIIVTAAAPDVPYELLQQLAEGGRLVIPVGSRNLQELVRITKTREGAVRNNLGACRFVPLLGESAWPEKAG
jgi:protein-L-isoaspartate(D-aspartate) O-methyltransferase